MAEKFDAIVVGAGPSGNTAAYTMAKAGLKVLQQPKVAERFKELGTDVGQPLTSEQLSQSLRAASDKHGANLKELMQKEQRTGRVVRSLWSRERRTEMLNMVSAA